MRIAICNNKMRRSDDISVYAREFLIKHDLTHFDSLSDLSTQINKGQLFDLILINIDLRESEGFLKVANLISRFVGMNLKTVIVSGDDEYAKLGYGIGVWDYISKPIIEARMDEILNRVSSETNGRGVLISTLCGPHKFKFRSIVSGESCRGLVILKTVEGLFESKLTLEEIFHLLPKHLFSMSHRSYFANLEHVVQRVDKGIQMSDGSYVPLGRTFKQEFLAALNEFYN